MSPATNDDNSSRHRVRGPWVSLLGLLLVLAMLAVNEAGYQRARAVIEEREARLVLRTEVARLQRLMLAAEAAQRGWLLTGRPQYKEPYSAAVLAFEDTLARIARAYRNSPTQQAEAQELVELARQKMSELATTTELFEQGKEAAWRELMLTDIGREKMAQIDALARTIAQRETEQLAAMQSVLGRTLQASRWGIALLVLAGAGALLALQRQQRRLAAERSERAAALRTERDRLEAEVERRTAELRHLASHLQTAREDERRRLARELHDELGGLLTAAKLDVARLRKRLPAATPELAERFGHLVQTLDSGIALKRRIIEDLHPTSLANLGLAAALEILCNDFARRSEIAVSTAFDELPGQALDSDGQLIVFRLVQEALTNIAKHARARQVDVAVHLQDDAVDIEVVDDGIGFDTAAVAAGAHGLAGMRFRVQSASGELTLTSTPGRGTVVRARLPRLGPDPTA
jgi:signal transduction histidine kinase